MPAMALKAPADDGKIAASCNRPSHQPDVANNWAPHRRLIRHRLKLVFNFFQVHSYVRIADTAARSADDSRSAHICLRISFHDPSGPLQRYDQVHYGISPKLRD